MTTPANPTPEPDEDEPLYRHCAGCNEHLTLRDGCEWNEDPALNLCFDCALKQLADTRRRLAEVEKERERLRGVVESAVTDFRKLKPFMGDAADATADLYQTYLKCSHT